MIIHGTPPAAATEMAPGEASKPGEAVIGLLGTQAAAYGRALAEPAICPPCAAQGLGEGIANLALRGPEIVDQLQSDPYAVAELTGGVAAGATLGRLAPVPGGGAAAEGTRGPASGARIVSPPGPGQVLLGGADNPMGAMVFEGHGTTAPGSFTVPEGTWLQVPRAAQVQEAAAQVAARHGTFPPGQANIFGPGSTAPNLVLHPPTADMFTRMSSTVVTRPTLLQDMLQPNMGLCVWGACTR